MKKILTLALGVLSLVVLVAALQGFAARYGVAILDPRGKIASEQRDLLAFAFFLSLIVIVPVFVLTIFIVWRYRDGAKSRGRYAPDWSHNRTLETIWWGIPIAIITILGTITWQTSHTLDPYRPIAGATAPLRVQVVALPWRWLFIYPGQEVASINSLAIPLDVPVEFNITADAPMNSFWVPQLGGQVYAMAGMTTKLHLQADQPGNYRGSSANISGEGFADMDFTVKAQSPEEFSRWLDSARNSGNNLDTAAYSQLSRPSRNSQEQLFVLAEPYVYDNIIMKYMTPAEGLPTGHDEAAGHN